MPPQATYAGTMTRSDDLDSILLGHNEFFDSVVNFIPASLYVRGNEPDRDHHNHPNAKYQKGTSKESKEARRARIKAAKAERYAGVDGSGESTVEAKARIERERRRKSDEEGSMGEDGEGAGALDDDGEDDGEVDDAAVASYREAVKNGGERPSSSAPSSSRIEALRAKLRAKIEEKRRQSGIPVDDADGEDGSRTVSKRAARRAEKRRRVEAAKAARKRKKGADASAGGRSSSVASVAVSHRTIVLNDEGDDSPTAKRRGDGGSTSVGAGEDLANIDYGNVAGLNKTPHHLDNRSLASSGGKKKSLDRLLEEAEKKKRRLEELRASEDGADRDKAARIQWGDALREAGGERVRDDPAMIKKAMKRKAKQKAKSAAAWKARTDQRDASMKERQAIRRHNLQKRKQGGEAGANLSRKRIVEEADAGGGGGSGGGGGGTTANKQKRRRMGPHSGQGRAGFEGRKQGFINGGGPKADGGKKAATGGGKTKGQ